MPSSHGISKSPPQRVQVEPRAGAVAVRDLPMAAYRFRAEAVPVEGPQSEPLQRTHLRLRRPHPRPPRVGAPVAEVADQTDRNGTPIVVDVARSAASLIQGTASLYGPVTQDQKVIRARAEVPVAQADASRPVPPGDQRDVHRSLSGDRTARRVMDRHSVDRTRPGDRIAKQARALERHVQRVTRRPERQPTNQRDNDDSRRSEHSFDADPRLVDPPSPPSTS